MDKDEILQLTSPNNVSKDNDGMEEGGDEASGDDNDGEDRMEKDPSTLQLGGGGGGDGKEEVSSQIDILMKPSNVGSHRVAGHTTMISRNSDGGGGAVVDSLMDPSSSENEHQLPPVGVVVGGGDADGDDNDETAEARTTAAGAQVELVATSTVASSSSVAAVAVTAAATSLPPIADAVTRDDLMDEARAQLLRESVVATEIVPIDEAVAAAAAAAVMSGNVEDRSSSSENGDESRSGGSSKMLSSSQGEDTLKESTTTSRGTSSRGLEDIETGTGGGGGTTGKDARSHAQANNKKKKKKMWMISAGVAIILIAIIVGVAIGVSTSKKDDDDRSSSSSSSTTSVATTDGTSSSGATSEGEAEPEWLYMISMRPNRWCGHNDYVALPCGGTLASVTNDMEKEIVDSLTKIAIEESSQWNITWTFDNLNHIFENQTFDMRGTWIGGRQLKYFQNDTGNYEVDVHQPDGTTTWHWTDWTAQWYDGQPVGSFWGPGQPNNTIFAPPSSKKNKTFGEHGLFLGDDGKYYDFNMCHGHIGFSGPAIVRYPVDYNDVEKYPDCQHTQYLLTDHQVVAPPRPPPPNTHVYVLDMSPLSHCEARDRAGWCGGHLASITSLEEMAMVYELAFRASYHSGGNTNFGDIGKIFSVWTGGMIESQDDGWYWTDGSPWFDDNRSYWQYDYASYDFSNIDGKNNATSFGEVNLGGNRPYVMRLVANRVDQPYVQSYSPFHIDEEIMASRDNPPNATSYNSVFHGKQCISSWREGAILGNATAAIYRIPSDYKDRSKYPNCLMGDHHWEVIPAPNRD